MTVEEIQLQNLHYFYSTAPQVLGAILAISGAFVVFKLEKLKAKILSNSQKLLDFKVKFFGQDHINLKKHIIKDNSEDAIYNNYHQLALGEEYKNIKYAQMADDYDKLYFHINKIKNSDFGQTKSQRINVLKDELKSVKKNFLFSYIAYKTFISNTYKAYVFNGIILVFLLAIFLFLPFLYEGNYYGITLSIGIIVSCFSLISIIRYLIKSADLKNISRSELEIIITKLDI